MAENSCCCSGIFSCLAFILGNTKPCDSCASGPNLADASANAIQNACPEALSSSAYSNGSPAAAAVEEPDGRQHHPQTFPSASTSHYDSSSSSAEGASTSHYDSSSSSAEGTSSSAVPTQYAPASGGPAAVDEEKGDVDLEGLIQVISKRLETIKNNHLDEKGSAHHHWPKSLDQLKEVLSEGVEAASSLEDIIPTARKLVKGIGQAHWALAGLLVVSNVLERFEDVSANREECISLLDEMYRLAKYVKHLKERPRLRERMEDIIQEALEMIVKASFMCFVQMGSSNFSRFCSASGDKEKLLKFQQELEKLYKHMKTRFDICLYDAIDCRRCRPPTLLEREYPTYAVGIEEPLKEVIKLLDWESEKNAVAVIVYGFGGVGKSTLADAVFARLDIVGCKYSMVRLFDHITSTPNIVKLQKCILTDLMMGAEEGKIPGVVVNTFENGQQQITRRLEKEAAFIYIDNALDGDRLRELLPRDVLTAKKVRVLITARDKGVRTVCTGCGMETKAYAMMGLPSSESMNLLKKEMKPGQIHSRQLNKILEISGGIPKLLTVVAAFINSEEDKQKAFRIVMEDKEHLKGQAFGDIEHYVFAYDYLPERCKDPFLDICSFFKEWNWDTVADIVGESELDMLEKRALVSKGRNETVSVHDVILMIGSKRAEETRFNFTDGSQIEEFLEKDISGIKGLWYDGELGIPNVSQIEEFLEKDISGIKGLWYDGELGIPTIKLDSMSNSLKILNLGRHIGAKGKCNKRFEKLIFFRGGLCNLPFNISQMPFHLKHLELDGMPYLNGLFELSSAAPECDLQQLSSSDLQQLRNVRTLRLINFEGLKRLPEELGDIIHGLRELTLSGCTSIEKLPRSISELQHLRILNISHCDRLSELPEDFGSLISLQILDLSSCSSIEELPESTSKLHSLKELNMVFCRKLKHLPKNFESLHSLEVLQLCGCESLKVFPKNFEKFKKLNPFSLSDRNILNINKEKKLREKLRVSLLVSTAAFHYIEDGSQR